MTIGVMNFPKMEITDPLMQALRMHAALQNAERQKQQTALGEQELAAYPDKLKANLANMLAMQKLHEMQADRQEKLSNLPFGGQILPGPAGQSQALEMVKGQYGQESDQYKIAKSLMDAQLKRGQARQFASMPMSEREQLIATAKGFGMDANQAQKYFMEGGTLNDLQNMSEDHQASMTELDKRHMDTQNVAQNLRQGLPQYAPTKGAIGQIQKQAQAASGLEVLGNYVADKGLNYGGLIDNYSHKWYWDANSDDAKKQEKAVDYLTAHVLKPEIAGLRMRMQQGQSGIGAIENLSRTIMGDVDPDLKYMPTEIQRRVQKNVNSVLQDAMRAESNQLLSKSPAEVKLKKNSISPSDEDLEFTAKKHGMTVEDVKRRLGL